MMGIKVEKKIKGIETRTPILTDVSFYERDFSQMLCLFYVRHHFFTIKFSIEYLLKPEKIFYVRH